MVSSDCRPIISGSLLPRSHDSYQAASRSRKAHYSIIEVPVSEGRDRYGEIANIRDELRVSRCSLPSNACQLQQPSARLIDHPSKLFAFDNTFAVALVNTCLLVTKLP